MDPELLRVLVPLGIFAFWAITKLSEKGAKPLDPRPNFPPRNPTGLEEALRAQQARVAEMQRQRAEPPMRWSNQTRTPVDPSVGRDDGIVILSETRTNKPMPAPRKQNQRQRASTQSRGQVSAAKPPKRMGEVNQVVSQSIKESMAIVPMTVTGINLSTSTQQAAAPVDHGENDHILGFRTALKDPKRIREAFIMSEILQPPVSRRPRKI